MKYRPSILVAVCLVVGLFASPIAKAYFQSGNAIYEKCLDSAGNMDKFFCMGYITGVADAVLSINRMGMKYGGYMSCPPPAEGMSLRQALDVAKSYLKKRADIRHFSASTLIAESFAVAWPCPKK